MSDANLATVRRFWDSIDRGDVDGYLATFTEDAVAYDPANGPPLASEEERRAFMEGLLGGFSRLSAKLDFLTPCGDRSAAKWTVDATTKAGDPVHLEGIDTYLHAADGRIRQMWGYFEM